MRLARQLLAQLPAAYRALWLTLLWGMLTAVVIIGQAYTLSLIISQVFLEGAGYTAVQPLLLLFFTFALGRFALSWLQQISAQRLASLVKNDLRHQLAHKLLQLGPSYTRQAQSGELTNSLTSGVEKLDAYLSQYLPQLYLALLMPLVLFIFILPLDWFSALILLLTAPLIPLFMFLVGTMANELVERQWSQLSLMSAHFLDVLQGLTTLKIFNRSRAQIKVVRQISTELGNTTLKVLRVAFLSTLVMELAATLSTALIAGEIGLRVLFGNMTFQAALFVLVLTPEFYLPLRLLGTRYHLGKEGAEAAGRLLEILAEPGESEQYAVSSHQSAERKQTNKLTNQPTIQPTIQPTNHPPLPLPAIRFENVSLVYPGESGRVAALQAVNLTLPRGKTTAVVGASGAGKSSLVNLLLRFVTPTAGQIWVGDELLQGLDTAVWRQNIAWVSQTPYIFHGTVAENLRLAHPTASAADLRHVAENAHAHEFISRLPHGYDTHLGDLGQRLSGGQRQRLALARAFLKPDAPLLILDEPTANLDGENEAGIMAAIAKLKAGRTVLLVAHRLHTIQTAEQIVLMQHGRVLAHGTDATLRTSPEGRMYRELLDAF